MGLPQGITAKAVRLALPEQKGPVGVGAGEERMAEPMWLGRSLDVMHVKLKSRKC